MKYDKIVKIRHGVNIDSQAPNKIGKLMADEQGDDCIKPEFPGRPVSQILWCFYRVVRGQI